MSNRFGLHLSKANHCSSIASQFSSLLHTLRTCLVWIFACSGWMPKSTLAAGRFLYGARTKVGRRLHRRIGMESTGRGLGRVAAAAGAPNLTAAGPAVHPGDDVPHHRRRRRPHHPLRGPHRRRRLSPETSPSPSLPPPKRYLSRLNQYIKSVPPKVYSTKTKPTSPPLPYIPSAPSPSSLSPYYSTGVVDVRRRRWCRRRRPQSLS